MPLSRNILFATILSVLVPSLTYAQPEDFKGLVMIIINILQSIVPLLMAVALLVFVWGLASYILQSGDPRAIETGRKRMIYGIIALFVVVGLWGIVSLVANAFLPL